MTNSQLSRVPAHFFRKATLKNSERFGTEELARIEGEMLEAREQSTSLEYAIFLRIREEVGKYIQRLQSLAQALATVDVLQGLACVAERQQLTRPVFQEARDIRIEKGRHPVVEKVMGVQSYIPNSISMDETCDIQLITGPQYERGSPPICASWPSLSLWLSLAPLYRLRRRPSLSLMLFIPGLGLQMTWCPANRPLWLR